MIVFYLLESGVCMLAIDCDPSDITISEDKAYYNGEVVNNDMTISAYAEVPKQNIYIESMGEAGSPLIVPKLFSELDVTSPIEPSATTRLAALEDAMLELLGA